MVMKLGVAIEDTWDFFHEIYAEFQAHHDVTLFERRKTRSPIFYSRINQYLFEKDLGRLMLANDVVFFEWSSHLLVAASNMIKTCKIVTRMHRFEVNKWFQHINWDNVDLLIVVSEAKRREVLARYPQLEDKIEVVYEATDPCKFVPAAKTYGGDIGILCHLTPRKRVYELILAFYDMLKVNSTLKLHIGGGRHVAHGDYDDALRDIVQRLGIQANVIFYGHVNAQEWYPKIDIFISNGYSEGLQVSSIEAFACGRYVLSHFWPGADELVSQDCLYFTNGELAEKVLSYHDTPTTYKAAHGEQMRARMLEKFNLDKAKVEIRELVEAIYAGNYRQRPQKTL